MSVEQNKINQRRVWEEIYNQGKLSVIPDVIASNWIEHMPMGDVKGLDGFKRGTTLFLTAFPDVHAKIDDMFAEGEKVVSRVTLTGTFKGKYMGSDPTGKKFTLSVIIITHWADGKEVETWTVMDTLSFYRQLGIPIPSA